ncbi:dynamin family protein [Paenibacillus sp. LjRoot153]|uniref:dynamin family protein n=1 Tax=Paenibacillus sp. LjRoot153 TaxID=3342270 RepID=UPI003F4F5B56
MPIAPVSKVDPMISEFMSLHPIEGETVLFRAESKFHCETLWGESEITGLCFATNYRFGVIGKQQKLFYSTNPYCNIRDTQVVDDATFQFRIGGEDWFDISKDSVFTVTLSDDNLLDAVIEHVIHFRYDFPPKEVESKFPEIFELMYRGEYENALQQLQHLKQIDTLSGMIDLLIGKVLRVTGKQVEATSLISKGAWKAILFHPQVMFAEYLWYPWHNGTLRFLPALSDLKDDRWIVQRYLIHAIHAKAQGQFEQFIKNSCLAFKYYITESEGLDPACFSFAAHCLHYLYPSTKSYVHEAFLIFIERYENLFADEDESSVDLMRTIFLEVFNESYDHIAWLQALESLDDSSELKNSISLAQENFSELLSCKSVKQEPERRDSWDLAEFLGYSGFKNEYDSHLLHIRDVAYKTVGAARTMGITSPEAIQGMNQLKQLDFFKKLELLEEESLGFVILLLQAEEHLANGYQGHVMIALQEWKRKNGHLLGLISEPYLQHAATILQAYEAWALGDVNQLSDALGRLPMHAPFNWIHGLLHNQRLVLEMSQAAYENESEVIEGMLQASKLTGTFSESTWLDLPMRDKAKQFYQLLNERMQEVDSLQHGHAEAAAGLDEAAVQPSKASWLRKVKSLFFGKKETMQEVVPTAVMKKPVKHIKIAIAGESSAGKTTLLNAIFRTNLFFVTQEEATGVPTEVRYGERMRLEVWDKSGQLRNTMETESSWFQEDGTTLLEQHLDIVSTFLMQHTKVGSPALEWVERVVVYAPLLKLPPHVVLVDTPGFNSDARRTAVTEAEMKSCHMCMYIMDARNALKRKEMSTLEFIREEAGKTFILLNKMDLVLGDPELDCDGGDAADETVARVRRDLAAYFHLPDVVVYPVSSMPREQLTSEAYRYAEHMHVVTEAIFVEAEHQQLDLFIDASAKTVIEVHQGINNAFARSVEIQEQEIHRMEKVVPQDFTIYEDQVQALIRNSIAKYRSEFVDTMIKELNDAFQSTSDSMVAWLQEVTSASRLKNEVQEQATQLLQNALTRIDIARKRELERMGKKVSEEAASFLQELYRNLPFATSFDSKSFLRGLSTNQLTSSAGLQTELSNINYGNGLNGGSVAGAIVGTFLLGPIGTLIGGFLGQLLGGKSLGDVKKEVYDTYVNTINQTWDQVAEVCDQDLSEERTASFMNRLNQAVQQQLEACRKVVQLEIESKESALREQVGDLIRMRLAARQLQQVMDRLRQWRTVRRAKLG